MKNIVYSKKILSSVFATVVVLYFMMTTPSPKIIFVPFLICGLAMTARYFALYLGKEKIADAFHMLFVAGFLLFLFGFLFAGSFYALEDNYTLLVFSIPFWIVGIWIMKSIFRRRKPEKGANESAGAKISFPIVVSVILVAVTLLAGAFILFLGIRGGSAGLVFTGAFFAFGALTFVLAALKVQGVFDNVKVDVLGIYMGIVVAAFGIGSVALKYGETLSLGQTIQEFGPWILVPVLMVAGGVAQIVKSLNRRA